MDINRQAAWELFQEFNRTASLNHHALAVEAVMRHFALIFKEDPEEWGIIGLLHDLDYEMYPDEHCQRTKAIMEERGWPESYIRAIMSHGWGMRTEVKPVSNAEKVLYTIDELTGLIYATALMRPSKISDLTIKSVKKKWKDTRFAAGVNRQIILDVAELLGWELNDIIKETIAGMQTVAAEIELA